MALPTEKREALERLPALKGSLRFSESLISGRRIFNVYKNCVFITRERDEQVKKTGVNNIQDGGK